ncbi:hypothetical protein [Streptomyces niveus]|uniref:hypothetical protein n=1 Tax=Streptomyces niveus TaxID=193462 RepID=UPI0035D617EF
MDVTSDPGGFDGPGVLPLIVLTIRPYAAGPPADRAGLVGKLERVPAEHVDVWRTNGESRGDVLVAQLGEAASGRDPRHGLQ